MPDPSDYDQEQDSDSRELFTKFQDWITSQGGPDLTPTEWKELEEPVPFSDRAIYPPYVVGGHLMVWKNGGWYCGCHAYPEIAFNPYWGVEGHRWEKVGIHIYDPSTHDPWIHTFGETTKSERLARIQEVLSDV